MENQGTTIRYALSDQQAAQGMRDAHYVTLFDGSAAPVTCDLNAFKAPVVTFGRNENSNIMLRSSVVSRGQGRGHGRFVLNQDQWYIEDLNSTNGIQYNDARIRSRALTDGDIFRIDNPVRTQDGGVMMVVSSSMGNQSWKAVPLTGDKVTIGRNRECTISLSHVSVSREHAYITRGQDGWILTDAHSTNGVLVNGVRVDRSCRLFEKDVITIANTKLIFTSRSIYYVSSRKGISVDVQDVVIRRGKGKKSFVTSNHVTLNVKPAELVAIIGGSGAGKSTILNAMCGYLPPSEGRVFVNGADLYRNFNALKKLIGYVPQQDIVYNDLTLYDMLKYTAKLRLPPDTSASERDEAIDRAIRMVELSDKKNSLIRSLSGGQRKRASIAVELLSDPNLLFLDEPASGLDPGTERNLMQSLRAMANGGKTVILVTHSTLQLKLCDKIVFMGRGGNLCFCGSYDEALRFFGIDDIVDVYNILNNHSREWRDRYYHQVTPVVPTEKQGKMENREHKKRFSQLKVLCSRYLKLVINDRQRLLLLMLQAPLLALLISFVADGDQFERYEMTKSLLFALSCCGFWIGMLNAIQEICKERTILLREYMTGLSLSSYVLSKLIVLSLMCLVQSLLVVSVFSLMVGTPGEGVLMPPFFEMYITTALTAISATGMGLFVSSLFTNPDRAMTVAPILLMPQILFSGLIFKLEGATKIISWFATCRWSMEGFGTTANLNQLPNNLEVFHVPHEPEEFFDFTRPHILKAWLILAAFTVVCLIGARLVLTGINKENQ